MTFFTNSFHCGVWKMAFRQVRILKGNNSGHCAVDGSKLCFLLVKQNYMKKIDSYMTVSYSMIHQAAVRFETELDNYNQ